MNMRQKCWLSVEESATRFAHFRANPDTVFDWIERKKLPAHKVGRLSKFKAAQVDEWARKGNVAVQGR